MYNEEITIESFITYCDDMMIAEEGFNPIEFIKTALQKLLDIIMTLIRRIKSEDDKIYMPRKAYDLYQSIVKLYYKFMTHLKSPKALLPENDHKQMQEYLKELKNVDWSDKSRYAKAVYMEKATLERELQLYQTYVTEYKNILKNYNLNRNAIPNYDKNNIDYSYGAEDRINSKESLFFKESGIKAFINISNIVLNAITIILEKGH